MPFILWYYIWFGSFRCQWYLSQWCIHTNGVVGVYPFAYLSRHILQLGDADVFVISIWVFFLHRKVPGLLLAIQYHTDLVKYTSHGSPVNRGIWIRSRVYQVL